MTLKDDFTEMCADKISAWVDWGNINWVPMGADIGRKDHIGESENSEKMTKYCHVHQTAEIRSFIVT